MNFEDAYKIVGNKKDRLKEIVDFIENNYKSQTKFTFSNKFGWSVFFRKSGKALCYINLRDNGFLVTVVIGLSLKDEVEKAKLSKKTKEMFKSAKQYFDGKWLNFDVKNISQVEDIKTLLLVKKNPTRRV